jgi:hypothetical protein
MLERVAGQGAIHDLVACEHAADRLSNSDQLGAGILHCGGAFTDPVEAGFQPRCPRLGFLEVLSKFLA